MIQPRFALLAVTSIFLLSACAIKPAETVTVYKSKNAVQCETSGMSVHDSANTLSSYGVTVKSSQCGVLTEVMFASVCGAKTGDIVIHDIGAREEALAGELGYISIDSLKTGEVASGFAVVDCK
ncbi:hypothetical protein [Enterovibrio norvegicus]|uniref:hypothetical protein n=1 Tax=Enterovibrio norvegicus TaxID=188144 RepID=UPI000C858C7E|nr:hypothetical protein [Enterovibrio norvegicus]PMI40157.1 hypothetical protein BCU46_06090 [Enterovibrio norvegicus]